MLFPLSSILVISSEDLGVDFYLKRDDLTLLGTGGNKLRKLEYFLKDAKDKGATMLITEGGAQTNHGRLTAAVAARYGLKCAIVTTDPYPGEISANLILDGIMGCDVYMVQNVKAPEGTDPRDIAMEEIAKQYEAKGETVYKIPVGGSNDLGALGYYECAVEIAKQTQKLEIADPHIFVTVGSMGTYIGLAAAQLNEKLPFRLTGIAIEQFFDERRKGNNKEKTSFAENLKNSIYSISFPNKRAKYLGLEIADIISYGYNLSKYKRLNNKEVDSYKEVWNTICRKRNALKKDYKFDCLHTVPQEKRG